MMVIPIITVAIQKAREEEWKRITAKDLFGLIELRKMVEGKIEIPNRAKLLVDWIKGRDLETAKEIFKVIDEIEEEQSGLFDDREKYDKLKASYFKERSND